MRRKAHRAPAAKKRRAAEGFTLSEMMVTVLILALATTILVTAMGLAGSRYREQLCRSKAQMLCASVSTFVQNELTYAGEIDPSGGVVTFRSNALVPGAVCRFSIRDGEAFEDVTSAAGAYGELYLTWGADEADRYPVVDAAFYDTDGIRAAMGLDWLESDEHPEQFHVTVRVSDTAGNALTENDFYVSPVSP